MHRCACMQLQGWCTWLLGYCCMYFLPPDVSQLLLFGMDCWCGSSGWLLHRSLKRASHPPPPPLQDLFSAMARPEHLEAVKSVVGVFARDVVGAYLAGPPQQQALEAPMAAADVQQQQPGIGIRCACLRTLGAVGGCCGARMSATPGRMQLLLGNASAGMAAGL